MPDPSDPVITALLDQCRVVVQALPTLSRTIGDALGILAQDLADRIKDFEAPAGSFPLVPWTQDLRAVLPRNTNCPKPLQNGWWRRSLDQIETVCFHHTLSHSPAGLAAWYITKEGGRPSLPYSIWIVEDTGEILLCNSLEEGCWHNFNGHQNTALSIGLAGDRTKYPPPAVQMRAAALMAAWAILSPTLPKITSVSQIMGHMDYPLCKPGQIYATDCPGWSTAKTGNWRTEFYSTVGRLLEEYTVKGVFMKKR